MGKYYFLGTLQTKPIQSQALTKTIQTVTKLTQNQTNYRQSIYQSTLPGRNSSTNHQLYSEFTNKLNQGTQQNLLNYQKIAQEQTQNTFLNQPTKRIRESTSD